MASRSGSGHSERGMTLVEVGVVVGIVGLMSGMATVKLGGPNATARNTKAFARSVYYALNEARAQAIANGKQLAITCDATWCKIGLWNGTDSTFRIKSGSQVQIAGARQTPVPGPSTPLFSMAGSPQTWVFDPDGSARSFDGATWQPKQGWTLFIEDTKHQNQYKIYTYGATGMSRLVEGW